MLTPTKKLNKLLTKPTTSSQTGKIPDRFVRKSYNLKNSHFPLPRPYRSPTGGLVQLKEEEEAGLGEPYIGNLQLQFITPATAAPCKKKIVYWEQIINL